MSILEKRDGLAQNLTDILKKAQYLVQSQPEQFALCNASNDWHSCLIARTELEAGSGVEMLLEISKRPDEVTQSIRIFVNENVVYRLDESSGKDAGEKRQQLFDLLNNETVMSSPKGKRASEIMLEQMFPIDDNGQVLMINDNYAETKVPSQAVDKLLSKANASLPKLRQGEIRLSDAVINNKFKFFD